MPHLQIALLSHANLPFISIGMSMISSVLVELFPIFLECANKLTKQIWWLLDILYALCTTVSI